MPVNRIRPTDVRKWRGDAQEQGVGSSALARAYQTLAAIMEMAAEDRLIPSSPVPKKKPPKHSQSRERRFLTREQVDLLADASSLATEARSSRRRCRASGSRSWQG